MSSSNHIIIIGGGLSGLSGGLGAGLGGAAPGGGGSTLATAANSLFSSEMLKVLAEAKPQTP